MPQPLLVFYYLSLKTGIGIKTTKEIVSVTKNLFETNRITIKLVDKQLILLF